jgi:hypothetical protein
VDEQSANISKARRADNRISLTLIQCGGFAPNVLYRTVRLGQSQIFLLLEQGVRSLPNSGPAGLIWGKINGEESRTTSNTKYEEFFVGTWQQFRNQC